MGTAVTDANQQPKPWEVDQPEDAAPPAKRWYRGMPSPNPRGRPRITDRRAKVTQTLLDDAPAIIRVVLDAAKEGDLSACGMVLARILPPIRAQAERVSFDFDPIAPVTEQIEAVLAGIASGALSADLGRDVIAAIGTLSNARAVEELEARIITLEARPI